MLVSNTPILLVELSFQLLQSDCSSLVNCVTKIDLVRGGIRHMFCYQNFTEVLGISFITTF